MVPFAALSDQLRSIDWLMAADRYADVKGIYTRMCKTISRMVKEPRIQGATDDLQLDDRARCMSVVADSQLPKCAMTWIW